MVEFVEAMNAEQPQGSRQPRRSALRSGIATGIATLIVSGSAAVAGAYLAHKFGRNARTDGFLAAYGVYLVIVLAAQAFRIVIVPDLTRGDLGAELRSWAAAFLAVGIPASIVVGVLSHPIGELLTGRLPGDASEIAGRAVVWMVPAGFAQLLAALCASALASRDSYLVAAFGYAAGAVANLVLFVSLAGSHGLIALAWGVALNGAISFAVPLVAVLKKVRFERGPLAVGPRLWKLLQAASVPLALQGLYLIALRGASGLGTGNQTSLTYAYLIASTLVAATASSLSMISSAPLTRRGVDAESAAAHVVHASWISLALIGAAAGVFALVGGRVVHLFLGGAFSGDVGRDLGHLVVYLAPWMVASVAFSVTYPLLFVVEKPRVLVPLALAALLVDAPLSLGLRAAFGLPGLVVALAITTFGVIVVLMAAVSRRMLVLAVTGLVRTALVVAALTALVFGLPSLALPSIPAAVVGLGLYGAVLLGLRPPGLTAAWTYVRALHH
jgi:peptidoglycan biosynthesis protein MviN/MurJ (putative lipid II flippase)